MVQVLLGANEVDLHRPVISASGDDGKLQKVELTNGERWLPVVGFEGWYEVSDFGRVRRIRTSGGRPICRYLKGIPDTWGYLSVHPSAPGRKQKTLRVHLLVADAFLAPRPEGFEVDHKSGVKADCSLGNLEVVTHSVNMKRAYALGLNPGHGLRNRWPSMKAADAAAQVLLMALQPEARP